MIDDRNSLVCQTKAISRVGYLLVVAALLGGLALVSPAQSGVATQKGQHQPSGQGCVAELATTDEFTEKLVADLTARGFQVSPGLPEALHLAGLF